MAGRAGRTVVLLFLLAGASAAEGGEGLGERLKNLKPGQWGEWMAVGEALARKETAKGLDRARLLFEACLRAAPPTTADRAADRLIDVHLHKKALFRSSFAAGRLLKRLARKTGEEGAIRRFEKFRAEVLSNKRALLEKAAKAREEGRLRDAEKALRETLVLPFTVPAEVGDRVDEAAVLTRLVELSGLIEKAVRERYEGKEPHCATCNGRSATVCPTCGGRGKEKKIVPPGPGRTSGTFWVKCTRCEGFGLVMCSHCKYTGFDLRLLDGPDRKTFTDYAKRVAPLLREPDIADALEKAQDAALRVFLDLPDTFLPDDNNVGYLFPLRRSTTIPAPIKGLWKRRNGAVGRYNLLIDFGVVSARTLRPYRLPLALRKTAKPRRPIRREIGGTSPTAPELVSAFHDFYHDRWVAVRGTLGRNVDLAGFRVLQFRAIDGEGPNGMVFYSWMPIAKKGARILSEASRTLKPLADFSHAYPFESVGAFLDGLETGAELEVFGRLIFRDRRRPRKLFEIWAAAAPGELLPPEREDDVEKGEELPSLPDAGPLFSTKEGWVLKRSPADRLFQEGHAYLRKAFDFTERAEEDEEHFKALNEAAIRHFQKARAFFEEAWEKDGSLASAHLVHRTNERLLRRMEAARER